MGIRAELENTSSDQRALLLAAWAESYSPVDKRTMKTSNSMLKELMVQADRKFKDTNVQFRLRNGDADPVVLSPLQAIAIHEAYQASYNNGDMKGKKLTLLMQAVENRNSIIHNLTLINHSYKKKLQDLMWYAFSY